MVLFVDNKGYMEEESKERAGSIVDVELENNKKLYTFTLPIMWLLAGWVLLKKKVSSLVGYELQTNTVWVDGISEVCNEVKENATNAKALDIVYNFDFENQKGLEGKLSKYWIGMLNGQAVRNRFKIVKEELKQAIYLRSHLSEVRILSIASGSAQVVLEAMKETIEEGVNVKATLLDLDEEALARSEKLAKGMGISDHVKTVKGNVLRMKQLDENPNIVEMVGFMDYLSDKKAEKILKAIRGLNPEVFVTANIIPNREQFPLKYLFDWDMIYRTPQQLEEVLAKGGFNSCSFKVEPTKLYAISICSSV